MSAVATEGGALIVRLRAFISRAGADHVAHHHWGEDRH
jgi:hypothetical protein